MFQTLPSDYRHLVDIDHVDCPKFGPLGDVESARKRLRRDGLDLAWNVVAKRFAIVKWQKVHGWASEVPVVVMHATHGETGAVIPLSDEFLTAAVYLDRNRGTVESRAKARIQQAKDAEDAREQEGEIVMQECYREERDKHPDLRNQVSVPAIPTQEQ